MESRSRTEYSLLNVITGIGGYAINTIVGFICRMVFVRCLASDYLGINGLFTNILTMLSLAELGIGTAIVYALYKPLAENDEDKIASLVKFYGTAYKIIGVIIGVIGVALMPFLNQIITEQPNIKENIYLIYLIYLFNTSSTYFFSYRSSLITAAQKNYIVIGVNYIATIIQSVIQIGWLLLTKNYLGYLIIQSITTLVYNIIISHIAVIQFPYIKKKNIKPLEKKERRKLIEDVRDLTLLKISGLLVNSTDNIIITYFNGLSVSGITSNYTLFSTTLNSLLTQLFNGINASIGNHNVLSNDDEKEKMFNNINLMNFWLFGWAAIGILFVSSDLVQLCFGEDYVLSFEIPFVLALNFYIVGMQNAVWAYKNTLGIFHYGRFMQMGTAVLNIIFSILLGSLWGVFGILLASAIARLLTNVWYDPYIVFKHGLKKNPFRYFKTYIRYLIILIFASFICYFACGWIQFNIFINVILKVIVCSVIPNGVFIICFRNKEEFMYLENKVFIIINKIKTKIRPNNN